MSPSSKSYLEMQKIALGEPVKLKNLLDAEEDKPVKIYPEKVKSSRVES
jgi:hypothetical protein